MGQLHKSRHFLDGNLQFELSGKPAFVQAISLVFFAFRVGQKPDVPRPFLHETDGIVLPRLMAQLTLYPQPKLLCVIISRRKTACRKALQLLSIPAAHSRARSRKAWQRNNSPIRWRDLKAG